MTEEKEQKGMHRRRITLADGRYLIFYTFDEQMLSGLKAEGAGGRGVLESEPDPRPQAEEERGV
jgi:hypothetical protein